MNIKTNFTPGPWVAKYGITQNYRRKWRGGINTASFVWITTVDEETHITSVTRTQPSPDGYGSILGKKRYQADANAAIIAAAPELFSACKEAVRQLKQTGADPEDYEEISQAIAKAEGEL